MRQTIRLTESELRRMISESVKRVLNEFGHNEKYDEQWYNPFSWKSAATKKKIDARRRQIAQSQAEYDAEEKRKAAAQSYRQQQADYEKGMAAARERAAREKKTGKGYRTDSGGHIIPDSGSEDERWESLHNPNRW